MDDPFVRDYDAAELEIAAEFLTNWLPFLSRDLCSSCSASLRRRILSLRPRIHGNRSSSPPLGTSDLTLLQGSPAPSDVIVPSGWNPIPDPPLPPESPKVRMSWADMAQEDELEEEEEDEQEAAAAAAAAAESAEEQYKKGKKKPELSREQREQIRFNNVARKKDFICLERVNGRLVNILAGLELHAGVFSAVEQKRIVDFVYELQEKGRKGQLGECTYSEPQKWMPGKGRATIQFGCCYNYAMDKERNPPGILQNVVPDVIPPLFKVIIRRLIRWHVLPTRCIPDSCMVDIYERGDCMPPHIDSHDFVRPFCIVSFVSECDILFGSNLKIAGSGEFTGPIVIPLPVGSVLVLNGNGADVAKHCIPAVPAKRISITFRKMDKDKRPAGCKLELDLQNILPLSYDSGTNTSPDNGRGKQPAAQSGRENRTFRGRRSRRTPFQHNSGTPTEILPHRIMDGQPGGVASDSVGRGRDYLAGSSTELRYHPGIEDTEWQDNAEAGCGYMENKDYGGRRVRMEQGQIVVNRTIDEEMESLSVRNRGSEPFRFPRGRVRTPGNRGRGRANLSDDW